MPEIQRLSGFCRVLELREADVRDGPLEERARENSLYKLSTEDPVNRYETKGEMRYLGLG